MNKLSVVILTAFVASCCPAKKDGSEKEAKAYREYCVLSAPPACTVPFAVLAVNRTMFDGVEVSTSGYLFQSGDGYGLVSSREAAFYGAVWDGIALYGNKENFSAHNEGYVLVTGRVRKGGMTWLEMEVSHPVSKSPSVYRGPIPPIAPAPPKSQLVPAD